MHLTTLIRVRTLSVGNLISRSPLRSAVLFTAVALTVFALSPTVRAVSPAPDGGYPNANTAEGDGALSSLTTGSQNTATGFEALFSNTDGSNNTANGTSALLNNTASDNTAYGAFSLQLNTTGTRNTAIGESALSQNTTGERNTAVGVDALHNNLTGIRNTALGEEALGSNTTSDNNTAVGWNALVSNTTGTENTATGLQALRDNTTGSDNTANGEGALYSNTTGIKNTANGFAALTHNNGNFNTADGVNALFDNTTGINNTASGYAALASNTTGSGNIAIGKQAGVNLTTGSNNIDIGSVGVAGEANKIRIGKTGTQTATFIAGIRGVTVPSGVGVIIGSNGQLGTVTSSARFKEAIKPMDKTSEAILSLQPVTFRYKHEIDPDSIPQFGLVAEQVEKVSPDLVARDADGKVNTVRYEAVNAMLLNEFLKEHRKVQEQGATIALQQEEIRTLAASLREQASKIQKVSEQLELSKPAPRMVANGQ